MTDAEQQRRAEGRERLCAHMAKFPKRGFLREAAVAQAMMSAHFVAFVRGADVVVERALPLEYWRVPE